MDLLTRVVFDGPVLFLAGVVLVILGGAGLLATGEAGHTRRHRPKPATSVAALAIGTVLLASGAVVLLSG